MTARVRVIVTAMRRRGPALLRRRWQRWCYPRWRRWRRWRFRGRAVRAWARRRPIGRPRDAMKQRRRSGVETPRTTWGSTLTRSRSSNAPTRLSQLPEILFNLGQCYRKQWEAEQRSELGRRALHYYEAVVREAPSAQVRPDAEQFITELTPAVAAAEARERQSKIAAAQGRRGAAARADDVRDGQLTDAAGVLDRLLREPDNGRELLAEAYLLRGRVAAGLGDPLGRGGAVPPRAGAAPVGWISTRDPGSRRARGRAQDRGRRPAPGAGAAGRGDRRASRRRSRQRRGRQREDGGGAGARLPHGRRRRLLTARAAPPATLAVPRADAVAGRARRLLRARAGRARQRAGRERLAHAAVPAAGRGPDRDAPRAAALVSEVVVLDGGRRGGRRCRRGHVHRDETQPQQRAGDLGMPVGAP